MLFVVDNPYSKLTMLDDQHLLNNNYLRQLNMLIA